LIRNFKIDKKLTKFYKEENETLENKNLAKYIIENVNDDEIKSNEDSLMTFEQKCKNKCEEYIQNNLNISKKMNI